MGNTASAITCYPLKTGVMQGRLAVEGVMVISYFLCRVRHSLSLPLSVCERASKVWVWRPGQAVVNNINSIMYDILWSITKNGVHYQKINKKTDLLWTVDNLDCNLAHLSTTLKDYVGIDSIIFVFLSVWSFFYVVFCQREYAINKTWLRCERAKILKNLNNWGLMEEAL